MTKKLFYDNPYLSECSARILAVDNASVLLDQTVFFAFSGGQASDSGTIDDIQVKASVIAGDDIVYTLEKEPPFKTGDIVTIRINFEKRLRLMRLHSAAHVVHFLFSQKTGINELIGSNIEHEKARLDYSFAEPLTSLLPELEELSNKLFKEDNKINAFSDPANPGIRLWSCVTEHGEIACRCSGTHVRSTSEIGAVQLKRKNLGAVKERVEITLTQ